MSYLAKSYVLPSMAPDLSKLISWKTTRPVLCWGRHIAEELARLQLDLRNGWTELLSFMWRQFCPVVLAIVLIFWRYARRRPICQPPDAETLASLARVCQGQADCSSWPPDSTLPFCILRGTCAKICAKRHAWIFISDLCLGFKEACAIASAYVPHKSTVAALGKHWESTKTLGRSREWRRGTLLVGLDSCSSSQTCLRPDP